MDDDKWGVGDPPARTTAKKERAVRCLDKSRPFGQVCGASNGAAYEQDGICFNQEGREI